VFDRTMNRGLFLNARVYDVLGYRADDIRHMTNAALKALIHPDDLPRVIEHFRKFDTLPPAAVVAIEYRVRHTDGPYVWLASKETASVRDRAGRAERIVGCATDLTDQRQALAEKKKISKQLLRTQDEERRRIARELHDSTAQHLVAAGIGLTRLHLIGERESDARMDRADVQEILRDVRRGITEVQREIRALSYLLHPPALERLGWAGRCVGSPPDLPAGRAFASTWRFRTGRLTLESRTTARAASARAPPVSTAWRRWVSVFPACARVRQFRRELEVRFGQSGVLVRAAIPERVSILD